MDAGIARRAGFQKPALALVAVALTLFSGCASWSRPADLMTVDLRSLPTNAVSIEFAGARADVLEYLSYYSSLEEWHPASGPAPMWGESAVTTELRWVKCDRYGLVVRLPGRTWRVWWFNADQFDTSSKRVTMDLSVASESTSVGDEFLHRIGIVFGQGGPGSWDRYSRTRYSPDVPLNPRYWRNIANGGLGEVSTAMDLLDKGQFEECRKRVDLGCLEVADEACSFAGLGTDAQRHAVENIYDAYAPFEVSIQAGDIEGAKRALERMKSEFASLLPK